MSTLTQNQRKALEIISQHGDNIRCPTDFGHFMWPDAEGWRKVGKCGYGSTYGVGMRLASGGYLGRLRKAGLIDWRYCEHEGRQFFLTDEGRKALDSKESEPGGWQCGES